MQQSYNKTFIHDSKKYMRIWKHDMPATILIWTNEKPKIWCLEMKTGAIRHSTTKKSWSKNKKSPKHSANILK
jgi:hypothetical protein